MNFASLISGADLRQILLLAAVVLVPLYCIATKRNTALIGWICLTCCVDIFRIHLIINLPAAPFAGLCLLPRTIRYLNKMVQTRSGRAILLHFLYLCITGVVFGFLLPWSTNGVYRLFNETAQGRSVLYLIHILGDFSLMVFVSDYIRDRKSLERLLKYMVAASAFAALAGIAEALTRIDFYRVVTNLESIQLQYRFHGLNYEPRGLGLVAANGLLLSLIFLTRRFRIWWLAAATLNVIAIVLTLSTSALLELAAAVFVLLLADRKARSLILSLGAVLGLAAGLGIAASPRWLQRWSTLTADRLSARHTDSRANNFVEALALRTEVYDGSALMFFEHHPVYLLWGTGPGLISLPATLYVPARADYQAIWSSTEGQGVNSPPTVGILLELANGGLIGLVIWIGFARGALRGLSRLAASDETWGVARAAFLVAGAIYLVQASPVTPISFVLLSLGLAAERIAQPGLVPSPIEQRRFAFA